MCATSLVDDLEPERETMNIRKVEMMQKADGTYRVVIRHLGENGLPLNAVYDGPRSLVERLLGYIYAQGQLPTQEVFSTWQ